jgi:hypothetical protein
VESMAQLPQVADRLILRFATGALHSVAAALAVKISGVQKQCIDAVPCCCRVLVHCRWW